MKKILRKVLILFLMLLVICKNYTYAYVEKNFYWYAPKIIGFSILGMEIIFLLIFFVFVIKYLKSKKDEEKEKIKSKIIIFGVITTLLGAINFFYIIGISELLKILGLIYFIAFCIKLNSNKFTKERNKKICEYICLITIVFSLIVLFFLTIPEINLLGQKDTNNYLIDNIPVGA